MAEVTRGAYRRRSVRSHFNVLAAQTVLVVLILALWQFGAGNPSQRFVLIDEFFVSTPLKIAGALLDWIGSGRFLRDVTVTLQEMVYGFLIGFVSGGAVGFALGIFPFASSVLHPFITAANSVPRLALAPLFLLWFGLGMGSKVALVAVMVFFLTFYNSYAGAREVDRDLINVLRVMNASRWQIVRKVTLPSAAVWLITGLRLSIPYAFVGAIVGELISSNEGIGFVIARASGQFQTSLLFAAIFVAVVLSLLVTSLVIMLEHFVLRWKTARDGSQAASGF